MRRLVFVGIAVLVLGLVADIGTKALSEAQIERTARREAPQASADAAIPVFPFLPSLLLAGKVDEVSVRLSHVPAGAIFFDRLDFDLHGVEVSRRALLKERRVKLIKIDRGTVTAVAPLPAAVQAVPVSGLTARVVGRSILLRGGGVSASLPIPDASLIPCDGTVTVQSGRLRLSCTLEEIPPALVEAINQAS